ncbi:hypothetical protein HHI36_016053 [Cryptolaemus montrouzieri]|uniref:CUE domain-containing protein n=1 Tax=Cryptolaemus montrouzieri TaxID=559131 RepID=A0ABD2N7M3_9CUCU
MNELADIFGDFSLSNEDNEYINFDYFNFFKNPNKLPITNVFLERVRREIDKRAEGKWEIVNSKEARKKCINIEKEVIPALHVSWLPEHIPTFEYQEYDFSLPGEENTWFLENNKNYLLFLEYLVRCNYHQFWCSVLFKEDVQNSIRDFLLSPIPIYQYKELGRSYQKVYKSIFNNFYMVVKRLIFFKESESEYMSRAQGAKYLIESKLLNMPIAVTLTILYQDFDNDLIDELSDVFFTCDGQEKIIHKEVEHILKYSIVVFEMIKGKLTGKLDPGVIIVPISLEDKPKLFSLSWVDSVMNYLLNTVYTICALFRLRKSNINMALSLNIPEKLAKTYDEVFNYLYDLLDGREEISQEKELFQRIMWKLGHARSKFIDNFHNFITYLLDETISRQNNPKNQQEYLEIFIDTMTVALEYEIFICDYNFKYSIAQTVEMFEDFSAIDRTRAEYIITSLNNLERHDFIREKFSVESAFSNHLPKPKEINNILPDYPTETPSSIKREEDSESRIQFILGIFPHLGDGFVEKCLEHYDHNTDQVVQAILEDNLPPHIVDIPFDFPRIPAEPKPPKPVLAYRGKKPEYDDALSMLNDRKEKEKMKTLVMEGIKYNNRYDNSDDEYDDRQNYMEPDFVVEHEVEKYEKPNEEDLVSDTSYSENEFDDEGKPVEKNSQTGFKPFCEDPALARARYEAKFGAVRKRTNVVGKPKGQGQEKNVVKARQQKNAQKSSRANHNRKGGSQFKRNRGMIPS